MFDKCDTPVPTDYFLKPGFIFVTKKPALISAVLGSCVAVAVHDRKHKVGGMNHFQFPLVEHRDKATARYGNVATRTLIKMMVDAGSEPKHLEAQIFGGAYNQETSSKNIGRENIRIARSILRKARIQVVSEDVGGEKGRKIVFNTVTSEIAVIKVDKIRKGDWHPYLDMR